MRRRRAAGSANSKRSKPGDTDILAPEMEQTQGSGRIIAGIGRRPLRAPTALLLAVLVVVAIAGSWAKAQSFWGIDYYQFWVVGQAVAGLDAHDVYSDSERRRIGEAFLRKAQEDGVSQRQIRVAQYRVNLENYSTPFLYAVLHLFASGDYDTDLARHRALSLASMLLAIFGVCRLLRFSGAMTLAMVLACIVWFDPFLSEVRVSNVNALQLGLLVLFLYLMRARRVPQRQSLAGALLGMTVMFKPNLALVAVLLAAAWAIHRRWAKLSMVGFGFGVGVLIALVWSSVFFGSAHVWLDWFAAVRSMPADIIGVEVGNYAPVKLVPGWNGVGFSIAVLVMLIGVVLGFACWSRRDASASDAATPMGEGPDRESVEDTLFLGAGCLIYLLSAPLVWQHYFVLTVPILALVFRPTGSSNPAGVPELLARRILPVTALLLLNAEPLWAALPLSHESFFPVANGIAVLLLYGLSLWQIHHLDTGRWDFGPGARLDD